MTTAPQTREPVGWIALLLGLITLAVYLPAKRFEFLDYDDQQYITENIHVRAGLTAENVIWSFGYHAGNWHPFAWLSHMLDCQIYGLNPAGHHLTNVLLHVATTVLLFIVLKTLTGAVWKSALVAALFGWHPLHVESVAWVAERKDVLCAFFWMLTLLTYASYVQRSAVRGQRSASGSPASDVGPLTSGHYWLTLVLFALALMSKPMAVTLPCVLLLLDFWPLRRFEISTLPRLLLEKIPFFILSASVCWLTIAAQKAAIVSTAGLPLPQRVAHALLAYVHYAAAMFWPINLSVYYPYETSISSTKATLAFFLLAALSGLVFAVRRNRPHLAFGWLWFFGTLVPVVGLVQVGEQAWADRYTYLPLIGLFIAVVWGAVELVKNRILLQTAAVTVLVILAADTSRQLRYWRNTRTLFEHAAAVTPNNYMAVTLLGSLLAKEGKLDEATDYYQRALQYKPHYPEAHFYLGNALDQKGRLDEAIAEYRRALGFKPMQEQTHVFLGVALAKHKQFDEAETNYLAAIELNPESAVAHNNLARMLHTQGRLDEANEHYSAALKLDPKLAQAYNNLGILLIQKGKVSEGAARLRESLRLNPGNAESQYNLALALNQEQRWSEATDLFAKTVGAGSTDANAHYQFGVALAHLKKTRDAMSQYASALLLQPDFPDALESLSWILATDTKPELRNGTEAVRMAQRACEMTDRKDPAKLKTLAVAYAEVGRFPDAMATITSAQHLAENAGRIELSKECQALLETFKSGRPWRDAPGE